MSRPIVRQPPRDNLCTTNDGEAIEHFHGEAVVWWYERQKKNHQAETIPYVDVIFRYLDKYDVPAGYTTASVGISRLGSFRVGTIWKNGRCVGETNFGPEQIFSVDFTDGAWSYASFEDALKKGDPLPISNKDYSFRYDKTEANMLSFALTKDTNLLVPCVEFFARCYGSTSEVPRILSTYPWHEVLEKLYVNTAKDPNRWIVRPHHKMHDDDGLFLASILYDPYAQKAARRIYSQFDKARGNGFNHVNLLVKPWFQGQAKIACRGFWINDGNTFLCLEITGMSEPHTNPYEIDRSKYVKEDLHLGDVVTVPVNPLKLPVEQDPFEVTDRKEPDEKSNIHRVMAPGFRIIGDRCPVVKTINELTFSEKKVVPTMPTPKDRYSTGDGHGTSKNVGKIIFNAQRIVGNGGIINEMWIELKRLEKHFNEITELAWYNETYGFRNEYDFKLQPLPAFEINDPIPNEVRRWVTFPTNPNRRRGMLIAKIAINERSFYLFEIQRKKVRKGTTLEDEQISGLLLELSDQAEAMIEIDRICNRVRFHLGKFKKLQTIKKHPHHVFRHTKNGETFSAESTIRNAFKQLGVNIKSHKKSAQS